MYVYVLRKIKAIVPELSSAALELALICLSAIINCTDDRSSIDVFFAIAIDMFCCVLHFVFHIFNLLLSFYLL